MSQLGRLRKENRLLKKILVEARKCDNPWRAWLNGHDASLRWAIQDYDAYMQREQGNTGNARGTRATCAPHRAHMGIPRGMKPRRTRA